MNSKLIYLGTAKWGLSTTRSEAFKILDQFYDSGGREIDTATNYPINSKPQDYGLALQWIEDWINSNNINNLRVTLKLGSIDNSGSSASNLRPNNIIEISDAYIYAIGSNLKTLAIHWDNRGKEAHDLEFISETLQALKLYKAKGINLGFSGIKYPLSYSKFEQFRDDWTVQIKENIYSCKARLMYKDIFPKSKFIAYGINAMKINEKEKENIIDRFSKCNREIMKNLEITNFFDLSLLFSYFNESLSGFIVSPSSKIQLFNTIKKLSTIDKMKLNNDEKYFIYKSIKKLT